MTDADKPIWNNLTKQELAARAVMVCPYNEGHLVAARRFRVHLERCRKYYATLGVVLKTCPFNASHDVDDESFLAHLNTCPDRVMVDDAVVIDNECDTGLRSTFTDIKGDTEVPPNINYVLESEKLCPEGFELETWSSHSGVENYVQKGKKRKDPSRQYKKALREAFANDPTIKDIPSVKKRAAKHAKLNPGPEIAFSNTKSDSKKKKSKSKIKAGGVEDLLRSAAEKLELLLSGEKDQDEAVPKCLTRKSKTKSQGAKPAEEKKDIALVTVRSQEAIANSPFLAAAFRSGRVRVKDRQKIASKENTDHNNNSIAPPKHCANPRPLMPPVDESSAATPSARPPSIPLMPLQIARSSKRTSESSETTAQKRNCEDSVGSCRTSETGKGHQLQDDGKLRFLIDHGLLTKDEFSAQNEELEMRKIFELLRFDVMEDSNIIQ